MIVIFLLLWTWEYIFISIDWEKHIMVNSSYELSNSCECLCFYEELQGPVSVSWDYCNKLPRTGRFKTRDFFFLSQFWSLESRCWQGGTFSGEDASCVLSCRCSWAVAAACRLLSPLSHVLSPEFLCVCSFSTAYKDTHHWIQGSP